MGEIREFSRSLRLFLRPYRWRKIDPVPWAPLDKPLSTCRLAIVSSAGLVPPDQPRFDDKMRGGDPTYRFVSPDMDPAQLVTFAGGTLSRAFLERMGVSPKEFRRILGGR